ncbi:MAG: CPBP family intramembrane metalloprotease [Bacteroidales bacterium]|nr:CPBP family intramembrane metalloprotease [Bacteroidales bacterium]
MENKNYPFLDNAFQGKNEWWRYLITIILSILILPISHKGIIDLVLLPDPYRFYIAFGVSSILTLAVTCLLIKYLHKKSIILLVTTKDKIDYTEILKGLGIWFCLMIIYYLILYFFYPDDFEIAFNSKVLWKVFFMALVFVPIKTTWEEIFFRGYLLQGVGLKVKRPIINILIVSVFFAVIHGFSTIGLIYTFTFGFTFGIIVVLKNSIERVAGIHAMNNFFLYIFVRHEEALFGDGATLITTKGDAMDTLQIVLIIISLIMVLYISFGRRLIISIKNLSKL